MRRLGDVKKNFSYSNHNRLQIIDDFTGQRKGLLKFEVKILNFKKQKFYLVRTGQREMVFGALVFTCAVFETINHNIFE